MNQMTSPIFFGFELEPSSDTHALDISAECGLVHLKQFGQFRRAGAFPVGDRNEDGELAGFQSFTRQCSIIDRGNHSIELPHAKPNAFPFDSFGLFSHRSLYVQAFIICQGSIVRSSPALSCSLHRPSDHAIAADLGNRVWRTPLVAPGRERCGNGCGDRILSRKRHED
jgi:hypothetical protein